jgi:hypothetical protein
MIDITEYIQKPQLERQAHLRLLDPCLERGGMSSYFKGLLAHILDTTIPSGRKIHVCHACHNAKCSNPYHLYWGTPAENRADAVSQGKSASPYFANVSKLGAAEANLHQRRPGNRNGLGNTGIAKSEEHRAKIASAIKKRHAEGKYGDVKLGRRKRLTLPQTDI